MNTAVRRSPASTLNGHRAVLERVEPKQSSSLISEELHGKPYARAEGKTRVYVVAENRLLREALSRMLMRRAEISVTGVEPAGPFRAEALLETNAEILLLTARGSLAEDIATIRQVRAIAPDIQILMVGMDDQEANFFQYVRAGIKGYLHRDASAEDVIAAMHAVQAGEAVCSGSLCATLFRFLESEATSLPSARIYHQFGLTRREQQIVPMLAQGLTNKEIANHFCLSEQTIKNHLYRMKQKIGATDRLGIVHLCRTQGFFV
jgi:DNA-binding NarL/FixJ family response regulator